MREIRIAYIVPPVNETPQCRKNCRIVVYIIITEKKGTILPKHMVLWCTLVNRHERRITVSNYVNKKTDEFVRFRVAFIFHAC